MKNSNVMCLPLSLPFACFEINSCESPFSSVTCFHYCAEMLLIQEGVLNICLDQDEMTVYPGEAVMICPSAQHRLSVKNGESIKMILLRMDPDRLPAFPDYSPGFGCILAEARREKMPMRVSTEKAEKMELFRLADLCVEEAKTRAFGYDLNIISRLSTICMNMTRFWMEQGLTLPCRTAQSGRIYTLSGYIQQHLHDSLRVEDLAEYCGLSYPWFAKKFRDIYGISCKDYIEQIRVSRVEQFLLFTNMDLTKISEATGYADCSHMIKNFKRIMGITPGQYRLRQQR